MSDKPSDDGNDKHEDKGSSAPNTPSDSKAQLEKILPSKNQQRLAKHEERTPTSKKHPKVHTSGRSLQNHHHSMDMNSIRQDRLYFTTEKTSGSKGKSVSMDTIDKTAKLLRKNSEPNEIFNNNSFKENFMTGRLFRSNKVGPSSNHLQEVVTVSPVVTIPSACGSINGTRNPSCVHSQIVGDSGHRSASTDSMENICRICHDSPTEEKLITPCLCKGSMAKVHRTCLERWLGESGKSACEICGQEYNTVRVPKYRGVRSLIAWIRNPLTPTDSRNLFFDLACFFILTPLACLSAWLCVLGAKHYTIEEHVIEDQGVQLSKLRSGRKSYFNETQEARANRDASNSTWTSVGLLSLTGTLVAAYFIWIFVAVRYHLQVWREWQQRNFIVTIVPLANGDFSRSPPPPRASDTENEDSDSSSSSPVRRHNDPPPVDRNNNSDVNCSQSNCPSSNQERETNNPQHSSNPGEISETALFYQSVFGGDSDESLSEEAMIRLATLRSEYDAILPPPTDDSKINVSNSGYDKDNNAVISVSRKQSLDNIAITLDINNQKGTTASDKDVAVTIHPDEIGKGVFPQLACAKDSWVSIVDDDDVEGQESEGHSKKNNSQLD